MPFSKIVITYSMLVSLFFLACAVREATSPSVVEPISAPIKEEARATEWNDTLAMAKNERKVVVYSTSGSEIRRAFIETFPERYGIELDMVVAKAAEIINKILSERRAGLYMVDVYNGGTPIITALMPAGAVDPIRPALILSEVTDPNMWFQKQLPITEDLEKKYTFQHGFGLKVNNVLINTKLVKEGEISSFFDLLQPRWKGKIALRDPTSPAGGLNWFSAMLYTGKLDIDYMKQLIGNELFVSRNDRLPVEWIAREKLLVGIAMDSAVIKEFADAGVPLKEIRLKESISMISAGQGGWMALMNKAPHPYAAKIFINWLASKEGQTVWSRASGKQSARIDVPADHLEPSEIRSPGLSYFDPNTEEYLKNIKVKHVELAEEIFGPILK